MASPQRQSRIYALTESLKGRRLVLIEELSLFFDHAVGVAGHKSFFDDIEDKLVEIAEIDGALESLERHFKTRKGKEATNYDVIP